MLEQKQPSSGSQVSISWDMTDKQSEAFHFLGDQTTTELIFGGAGGGGKSLFGCGWSIFMCLKYAGCRGVIAREELKSLKDSTLLTFFELCGRWGLQDGRDYEYNATESYITFSNGSRIYLKELKFYPSDPQFDYLGSTEYTFAFIDEASQVHQKAKNVLRSRLRYRLREFGLVPKMLLTCNPDKGYLYAEYYKPWKDGTLPKHIQFVQALVGDNPFIDPTYIQNLMTLDNQTRERLLFGNWEYDDDPATLCDYSAIVDMFTNVLPPSADKYIIADIARFGDDRTVISYWEGWQCKRIAGYKKLPLVPDPNNPDRESSAGKIKAWREQYQVPLSHVLIDEDGVGGGVKDYLGCVGFMGGRSPYRKENFLNLRAQCYFFLAKKINDRGINVHTENMTIKSLIIQEMEMVKAKDRDKDKKMQIIPKDEVKQRLGRSPDFSDNLMMRCMFEFASVPRIQTFTFSR